MKHSLLKKFLPSPSESTHSEVPNRTFMAETLESRVLFSAAPIDAPVEAAEERFEGVDAVGFEGIENFSEIRTNLTVDPLNRLQSTFQQGFPEIPNVIGLGEIEANSEFTDSTKPISDQLMEVLNGLESAIVDLDGKQLGYSSGHHVYMDLNTPKHNYQAALHSSAGPNTFNESTIGEVQSDGFISLSAEQINEMVGLEIV